MEQWKHFFVCAFILAAAIFSPLEAGPPDSFRLGNENWIFAGETRNGETSYVRADQDPNSWTEVLVFYNIPAGQVSLPTYYKTFMEILNKRSDNLFKSQPIQSNKNSILFKWWTVPDREQQQQGLVKIIQQPSGLQFLRYTTRDPENSDQQIKKWEKVLADTTVEMRPSKVEVFLPWQLDGRTWSLTEEAPTYYIYTPNGEKPGGAQEKVTVHIWSTLPLPLNDFYPLVMSEMNHRFNLPIESRVLKLSDTELFFEWWINEGDQAQHEWYRIEIIGPNVAVVVRYTTKNLEEVEKMRPIWEEILKNSHAEVDYDYEIIENGDY